VLPAPPFCAPHPIRKGFALRLFLAILFAVVAVGALGFRYLTRMPGPQHKGTLPQLTQPELEVRSNLQRHVSQLAGSIGERNLRRYEALLVARDYISAQLAAGGYRVNRQTYQSVGRSVDNVEVEVRGSVSAHEIVIIGAHYDTVVGTPGANDNGSGVAAVLELARMFRATEPRRTLRFVFFVNEEPPYFQSEEMGSWQYARRSKDRGENIKAMFSIETIGYYSDEPDSQQYPSTLAALYPKTANFIGFVSNVGSAGLLRRAVERFRKSTPMPAEGAAAPEAITGVGWSDQWSFWKHGYPGVMVTDTALYRYPHYHASTDTPDKLDYDRTARVVTGLAAIVRDLAGL